jgi:hypothetical protein
MKYIVYEKLRNGEHVDQAKFKWLDHANAFCNMLKEDYWDGEFNEDGKVYRVFVRTA